MKKSTNFTLILIVSVSLAAGVFSNPASAMTPPPNCSVKAVGTENTANTNKSRFTLNGDGTVSSTFIVSGTDCHEAVTLASWEAPDGNHGLPYSEQKFYKATTGVFKTGTHKLTVALPADNCYYQVDLVTGSAPTDPNGGPLYGHDRMRGSLHGGTQTCKAPTVPVTPTKPVNHPVTPVTTLPNTGTGSNLLWTILAVVAASTIAYRLRLQRQISR